MNADGIFRFDLVGRPYLICVELRDGIGIRVTDSGDRQSINHLTIWCNGDHIQAVRKAVEQFNRALTEELTNAD